VRAEAGNRGGQKKPQRNRIGGVPTLIDGKALVSVGVARRATELAAFSGLYPRRSYSLVVLCHCEANPLDPSADRGSVNRQDNGRGSAALRHARAGRRKSASHASQRRVSTASSGASALRPFAGGLSTSSATGDETHFCPVPLPRKTPSGGSMYRTRRNLRSPSDTAQPSFALAEGPRRRGMERAICHGPRQPTVADDHRPIGEPGGDKLPRQLVGGAMSRSRGVGAAFDCRLGYPDAAEFDVRVASSGQVVTAIGITRICRAASGVRRE